MFRILSLAVFAVATASIVSSSAVTAQDSDSCQKSPNCQAIKFELAGIDLSLTGSKQNQTNCQEANLEKNEIAIQVKCNGDIPFLNSLPLLKHVFQSAPAEECEIFVFDSNSNTGCGTCDDGCICCEQCNRTCCGDKQKEIRVEVTCDGQPPFLSNVPYVSRLFKNVGFPSTLAQECQDGDCSAASAGTACAAAGCETCTCETPACGAGEPLRLASYHEAFNEATGSTRDEMMHELMEAHVENARLEARVEAMEHHMELMQEMSDVRAENAALRAQLKLMERLKAETTSFKHLHQPTGDGHKPYVVIGLAQPPHAAYSPHGPHGNKTKTPTVNASATSHPPVSKFSRLPTAQAAIFANGMPGPTEIQRVAEQVLGLQKELKQQDSECSKNESGCKKAGSK